MDVLNNLLTLAHEHCKQTSRNYISPKANYFSMKMTFTFKKSRNKINTYSF